MSGVIVIISTKKVVSYSDPSHAVLIDVVYMFKEARKIDL